MPEVITDTFDLWTSALLTRPSAGRGSNGKQEAYGIKKLRELILGTALRGLFAKENESLAETIDQDISNAKMLYYKAIGKKPKEIDYGPPLLNEFKLPPGWVWKRVGELCDTQTGATPNTHKPEYFGGDIRWLVSGDINEGIIEDCEGRITERGLANSNCKVLPPKTVLIALNGQGKTKASVALLNVPAACNQSLVGMIPFDSAILDATFLLLSLKYRYYEIRDITGQNQRRGLNMGLIAELSIPLPPIAEQHHIVAKVDELMALCDQLEQQQAYSMEAHRTLVETLLGTLTHVASTQEFTEAWNRIANHFDTLFTTEHSIDQLKQTILQLAVMGKLAEQNPSDPPASQLLKEIETEKKRLAKEGKIKAPKPLLKIKAEEAPYVLPEGWEWVRLGSIASKITDGDHKTPPRTSAGMRLLSAKNVRDGYLDFDSCDLISEQNYLKSRERCCPETGDLLIVSVGGTIGRTSLVPTDSDFALVRSVALIKPLLFNSLYLKHTMDSSLLQDSIHSRKRGGAQPCLYLSEIEQFIFPLPPLSEQHRIVAKVDELMALCDALKSRLADAQTTQIHLADAIVEQVVT
jgi:type I restriction enzyme S subunit